MPASENPNAHYQAASEPSPYYRPLLQLDNSPSWIAERPGPAHLDGPPEAPPNAQPLSHIQHEIIVDDDDDDLPTKHEGHLLSVTPTPVFSPIPRLASGALSPPPPMFHGHTRSPVLARQPTMFENFSRTVRNYVPASIPVPTAAPSPRVPIPVSAGNFVGASIGHSPPHGSEGEILTGSPLSDRRRARQSSSRQYSRTRGSLLGSPEAQTPPLDLEDRDIMRGNHLLTAYPTVAEGDDILWSRWDSLPQPNSKPRRVLFLGYSSGFQMWDCTNLASVSEVLNLSAPSWGHVTFAGVLPPPVADDSQLTSLRPLIGVISRTQGQSIMLIYSLRSHEVVKRLPFHNVSSFASSKLFTIISTTNPPTLHILSSASLTILHTISSSSIFAYSRTSTHKPNTNDIVSLSGIDAHNLDDPSTPDDPTPIYSLSHRLLAFTAQPPRSDLPQGSVTLQPRTHIRASSTPFGISQADLGNAAVKVGGTVLSGMKSLGGMAYNAAAEYARSRSGMLTVTPASPDTREDPMRRLLSTQGDQRTSVMSGVSNLFFSRSAPAASSGNHGHDQAPGYNHVHPGGAATTGDVTPSSDLEDRRDALLASSTSTSGSYVRVLDLGPLADSRTSSHPQVIAEFVAAKHQSISHLAFTHDGNTLLVGPRDGQVVRVFQLRRRSHVFRGVGGGVEGGCDVGGGSGGGQGGKNAGAGAGSGSVPISNWTSSPSSSEEDAPWHLYSLRRGRTSAVIQHMEVSPDGRWAAIGTLKGTVHVYAINPYGGQPDLRSHMDTKIWNVDKPQPLSVELTPLARLRSTRATGADGFRSDLSFTFVWGSEMMLPTSLLPPQMASSPSTSSGRSDLPSSHSSHRQHNFKDVLVFDASGGVLSLRRIALEQRSRESGIPFSSPIASLATSISLPGVGAAGRLSASPPVQIRSSIRDTTRRRSGLTQQMLEAATELVGKDSMVATWQLRRRHDWGEVKRVVHELADQPKPGSSNSLAHAELSTCARAPDLVPRSIYLSHQFLFYSLGEDYHALIRRHRLAISGPKIDVRKEVEASASARTAEEHFVEDLAFPSNHSHARSRSHPRTHHHAQAHGPSSFDEPLASAMSAELAYDRSAGGGRVMIPMLPNGAAQQPVRARTGTSWSGSGTRAALSGISMGGGIPIKVMEGVGGMIRREMDRVRGGRAIAANEGGVPLEFDEQDEVFGEGALEGERGRDRDEDGDGGGGGDDSWRAWSEEDRLAVDEAERFDDVLGIMDEDQVSASAPATSGMGAGAADQW